MCVGEGGNVAPFLFSHRPNGKTEGPRQTGGTREGWALPARARERARRGVLHLIAKSYHDYTGDTAVGLGAFLFLYT